MFGPFAAAGDQLWVFSAGNENDPTRTLYSNCVRKVRRSPSIARPRTSQPQAVVAAIPTEADLRGDKPPQNGIWLETLDLSQLKQQYANVHAGRSVEGTPLSLGGLTYRHGIGTHAASDVLIELKGAALRFEAVVGVDDERQRHGLGAVSRRGRQTAVRSRRKSCTAAISRSFSPSI